MLIFVSLAMIPVVGLEVASSLQQRREAAAEAVDRVLSLANLAATTERDLLHETNQLLAALALLPSIQHADADACNEILAGILELHPYTANLGLINREGDLLCSALPFTPPINLSDRAYFQRVLQSRAFAIGDFQVGRVTGIPNINAGYPVLDPEGDLQSVVFAAIDLTWVNLLAENARLPEGSTVTSIDTRGVILAHFPDPDTWISKSMADTPLFAAVSTQVGEGIVEEVGIDGVDRLYGYTPLLEGEGEELYLIVGIPISVVFDEANRSLAQGLIGLTVIVMVGFAVALVGSEVFLMRDIKKLVNAAHQMAFGDLKVRADPASATSEFGELAQAFNAMAVSLQVRVEDLEQTEDRLRRINRSLKVLSASNQMVVRSGDEESLLKRTCDILVEDGGYRMAWVGFAETDKKKSVRPFAQSGSEDGYLETLGITWADTERGRGPTGTAIRTGEPSLARHILTDPAFEPWREQALKSGYQSLLSLPLNNNGVTFGALNIYSNEPDAFDEEELGLLDELASDVSYGVLSLRNEVNRKQAVEEIRRLKEFNENIVQTITDGIMLEDAGNSITFVNPAAARILGYDADELIGLSSTVIISPDSLEIVQKMNERRHARFTDQYEVELIRKDGGKVIALVSANPRFEGDRFAGSLVAFADITALRLGERKAQLRDRLAVVGEMAAGIAHDFNNILGGIILYSQLLLKRLSLPEDDQKRLEMIGQQASRGADLVGQILDFSRKTIMERHPLDLSQLLLELKPLLERTLPENIRLEYRFEGDEYTANADPTRMQQIVMNLVINARDAMPEGGELRFELERIQVQSGMPFRDVPPGEWVRLTVADTGSGIPEEILPRIFEPFFTTKPVGEGTGLGLAQVYGIVRQHDGYIDVVSKLEQGTSFIIYLPFDEGIPVEADEGDSTERIDGRGCTIMLVEDNDAIKEAAAEILRSMNFRVLEASSGKEAVDIFAKDPQGIGLVISDLVMPDMGGRELYGILQEAHPEVKIVLMTGYPLGDGTKELLEQVTWMIKPFNVEDLVRVLHRVLG